MDDLGEPVYPYFRKPPYWASQRVSLRGGLFRKPRGFEHLKTSANTQNVAFTEKNQFWDMSFFTSNQKKQDGSTISLVIFDQYDWHRLVLLNIIQSTGDSIKYT